LLGIDLAHADEVFLRQIDLPQSGSLLNTTASAAKMLAAPTHVFPQQAPQANTHANANTAQVTQVGSSNFATLAQSGSGNAATVAQQGRGNIAMVTQTGRVR
jgi:hypothetical protein